MADPDWIGRAPQDPYWADNGQSIFFSQKRLGEEELDLVEIDLEGERLRVVADQELGSIDASRGRLRADGTLKVYTRHGDLFVKNLRDGGLRQLTRTVAEERQPFFMADGSRIAFLRHGTFFVRDLESGLESQPFDIRMEDDPADEDDEDSDYLQAQQERLFTFIAQQTEKDKLRRRRQDERRLRDPRRADPARYLGADFELQRSALSPSGDWLAVVVRETKHDEGRHDSLPRFVSRDGFVDNETARVKVGNPPAREKLLLLQRSPRRVLEPAFDALPEIDHDPLAELREAQRQRQAQEREAQERAAEEEKGSEESDVASAPKDDPPTDKKPRPVRIPDLRWSPDGRELLVQVYSLDNKDRWIATVDLENGDLRPLEHFHDPAWINRRFSFIDWLPDSRRFYFLSEESGYSHLYIQSARGDAKRALTAGSFVVCPSGSNRSPQLTRDGKTIYFTANREHPSIIEAYRVEVANGRLERLTNLGGAVSFVLSPDEKQLLLQHSTSTRPPELFLQEAAPGATARALTQMVSDEHLRISWTAPEIVEIPSTIVDRPIYARLYLPQQAPPPKQSRPAVVFIHGAGYLQNAHRGWSSYFREFMFHSLLTERGYVVLDLDYRASAGYGRDWRTAIYRRMGTPELEDLEDGVRWLVEKHGVDADRVGTYGGSYGGFLTLMALFRKPDLFASGAALRPVTDWAHYNHGYTSNILNTPDLDPEAYERSSPIEFAAGLTKPLLLCHGILDDNVLFQDTVRLAQRLIELGKTDWEAALYPVERHGFREPSSWLDEYRRILELFETTLH